MMGKEPETRSYSAEDLTDQCAVSKTGKAQMEPKDEHGIEQDIDKHGQGGQAHLHLGIPKSTDTAGEGKIRCLP